MIDLNPHLLEALMLLCFGCSWPFAIAKTMRTKTVQGKSLLFITLVLGGYAAGIISKLIGRFDHIIWIYLLNGSMVLTEMLLYFRYRNLTFPNHGIALKRKRQPQSRTEPVLKNSPGIAETTSALNEIECYVPHPNRSGGLPNNAAIYTAKLRHDCPCSVDLLQ